MRITFLTHFPGRGGSTVLLQQLRTYFEGRGHACSVVCGSDDPTPLLENYVVVPRGRGARRRAAFLQAIHSTRPEVVYSISGIEELDLLRNLALPRVRHVSSFETHDLVDMPALLARCAGYLDLFTANTPDVLDSIRAVCPGPVRGLVAPYRFANFWFDAPAPDEARRQDPAGRIRICYVGRLEDYQKRAHWLAEIIPAAERAGIPLEWHIHGDGPEREFLQRRLTAGPARNLPPVHFEGWQSASALRTRLPEYDVFFLCSRWEGLPISLVEAMLCGQAGVVPAIPAGIQFLLGQRAAGWMYAANRPADAVQALWHTTDRADLLARRRAAQTLAREAFSPARTDAQLRELESALGDLTFNGRSLPSSSGSTLRASLIGRLKYRLGRGTRRLGRTLS